MYRVALAKVKTHRGISFTKPYGSNFIPAIKALSSQ